MPFLAENTDAAVAWGPWISCLASLWRSAAIAILAVLWAVPLWSILTSLSGASKRRLRRLLWAGLLVTLLTPSLLVGYAYASFSLTLVRHDVWNQLFFILLMSLKLAPIAVLMFRYAPAPMISRQAVFLASMLHHSGRRARGLERWRLLFRGRARQVFATGAVVFLLAVQEFEITSLLGVKPVAWTERLFDLQAFLPTLSESLQHVWPIAMVQLAVLAVVLMVFRRANQETQASQDTQADTPHGTTTAKRARAIVGLLIWLTAIGLICIVPTWYVLRLATDGLDSQGWQMEVLRHIGHSAMFALAGTVIAFSVAGRLTAWLARRPSGVSNPSRTATSTTLLLCLPGLLGSLIVGVAALYLFRSAAFRWAYDTPLPLAFALALLLLPVAIVLRLLLLPATPRSIDASGHPARAALNAPKDASLEPARQSTHGRSIFIAEQLAQSPTASVRTSGRRLLWQMRGQIRFWLLFVLFVLAYFDLTSAGLLHPSGMTPATVLLYNLMHYQQTAVLSAMVAVTALLPLVGIVVAWASVHVWQRVAWR